MATQREKKIILAGKYVLGPLDFSRSSEMILSSGPPPALMASGLAYLSLPASTPSSTTCFARSTTTLSFITIKPGSYGPLYLKA